MRKNNFIRAVSIFLAAGVLLASAGCGGKTKTKTPELNQPVIENSTAVIEYTSINEKGEETNVTTVQDVNIPDLNKPVSGMSLAQKLESKNEAERFEKNKEDYNISEDEYNKIVEKADEWISFNYLFYVANSTPQRILFRNIKYNDNKDIKINSDLGCEYGVPSGSGMSIVFSGYVNSSKYESEDALKAALSEMGIQIIYTSVESIDDSVDDWSKVSTKTMDIDFTK